MKKARIFKVSIPIFIFLCYYFIPAFQSFTAESFRYLREYNFHGLKDYLLSYGKLAPIVSVLLMILQSVVPFVPGVLMTITNAWLFGWIMGSMYSGIGALLGAVLDFYIARWYGKSCFEYMAGERYVRKLDYYVQKHGAMAVFVTRLMPIIPFKVISYSAGLSKMNVRLFIMVTFLGQMPAIILYSILGENIFNHIYLVGIITIFFCVVVVILFNRKEQ